MSFIFNPQNRKETFFWLTLFWRIRLQSHNFFTFTGFYFFSSLFFFFRLWQNYVKTLLLPSWKNEEDMKQKSEHKNRSSSFSIFCSPETETNQNQIHSFSCSANKNLRQNQKSGFVFRRERILLFFYRMTHFIFFRALFSFFPAAAPSESVFRDRISLIRSKNTWKELKILGGA